MRAHSPSPRPLAIVRRSSLAVLVAVAAAGCDTGDGTTLQQPATPTTLPPPDTTPLASVAIDPPPLPSAPLPGSDEPVTPPADDAEPGGFRLFAPWADGGPIDARYSCVGSNVSPAISWADVPEGTAELAVVLVDESNLSNGEPFVHWIMGGLDASTGALAEGEVPIGAFQALNFFGDVAYAGPCPDPGTTNEYRLTLLALNQQLEVADGTPATELLDLINTVAIDTVSVTGTSTR